VSHVITQNCCNDASCVPVCPVNCIHPTPDEPDYATAEMLYIDSDVCIDCGACLDACPVNAISPDYELPEGFLRYEELAAHYYDDPERSSYDQNPVQAHGRRWSVGEAPGLRVAVVGAGPAAFYAAEEILAQRNLGAEVDMFERLPTPGGLVRFGVAPDHQATKSVSSSFARTMRRKGFRLFLNVEIGRDLTHEQLADRYHAVIYAVGAMADRALGIPGEDLPGSHSATEFVAWYNGHPDFATKAFDLSAERAVILGNGNVALDVARMLVSDVEDLRRTDIADHALEQLEASSVREVVVVGRRGAEQAAFTTPELLGLAGLNGVDLVARPDELVVRSSPAGATFSMGPKKAELLAELGTRTPSHDRRVTLRFLASPAEIVGRERVEGVRLVRNELVESDGGLVVARPTGDVEELACGLVLRSVGYRGRPVEGLAFDEQRAIVPNEGGRVLDGAGGEVVPGVYVTGWIKRGPSGVIGSNKKCAKETVAAMFDDLLAGRLGRPAEFDHDIADLAPGHVGVAGWAAIDDAERAAGKDLRRPRVKLVDVERLLHVARSAS
jgi:ferredoxin/flavodoxin---NADP+ reductase